MENIIEFYGMTDNMGTEDQTDGHTAT